MKKKLRRIIIDKEDLRYMTSKRRTEYVRSALYAAHFQMNRLIIRRFDLEKENNNEVLIYEQEVTYN